MVWPTLGSRKAKEQNRMHEKPLRCRSLPRPVGEAYSALLTSYLDLEGRDSRAWEWKESKGLEMRTKGRKRRKGR